MSTLAIVVVVLTLAALVYVKSYNRLANERESVDDAWSTVEDELRHRHELIPELVVAVTASAVQEPRLLDELARAERAATDREGGDAAARSGPERDLADAFRRVVGLREQYPALDTDPRYVDVRRELAASDERIDTARRRYNLQVGDLNRRLQAFPSNAVARRHGVAGAAYFEE